MSGSYDPAALPQGFQLDAPPAPAAAPPAAGAALPAGFQLDAPPAQPQRTPLQQAGRQLGLTTRDVIEGAAQIPDMLNNAGAALGNAPVIAYNAATGGNVQVPFAYGAVGGAASGLADRLGLPKPEGTTEKLANAAAQGIVGNAPAALVARAAGAVPGIAGQIARSFGDAPVADAVGGALGGAAQTGAQMAGGGDVSQAGANLGGNLLGALVVQALTRRPGALPLGADAGPGARGRAAVTPDQAAVTPPEIRGVPDDVAQAYRAQGFDDGEITGARQAFDLAQRQRERATPSAVDTQPGTAPTQEAMTPRMRQDFQERAQAPASDLPPMTYRAEPDTTGYGALVPTEPPVQRMAPDEIARAQAEMRGGNPNTAEPPPRFVAPEGQLPRTPEQVQGQREAGQAFDLAAAQRERIEPNTRDTQPAGAGLGPRASEVMLDQGHPVRVLHQDERGFATVERYDPRTGQTVPDAVPYVVQAERLDRATYTANPRLAQDFTSRAEGPPSPEVPRDFNGPVQREPDQTFRATAADPNVEFPGAAQPGPEEGMQPPGRSPLPEQPEGPAPGRAWSDAEEAERAFRQQSRSGAPARVEAAAGSRPASITPRGQDAAGRWHTTDEGFVASNKGGPIRFGEAKQAARWIVSQGQKRSPDQFFEIATHPSGMGYTVRESGRNPGPAPRGGGQSPGGESMGASPGGGEASPRGTPPRSSGGLPPLYANPIDPAALKRYLLDPALDAAKQLRNQLMRSSALRSASNVTRQLAHSNRAVMRALGERYPNIPEIREMTDMLASDPGTGRHVKETFETAFQTRATSATNRMLHALGRDRPPEFYEQVRDALTGQGGARAPEVSAAARGIRKLLDEHQAYLKGAGVDLGYTQNYYPRTVDASAVLKKPDDFKAAARSVYQKTGLDDAMSDLAADDWYGRVVGVNGGAATFGSTPAGAFTKGRKLPAEADQIMREFYVTDPRENLASYFQSSSRVAEFTRRFGKSGAKAEEMFASMVKQGMHPNDQRLMRDAFQSATHTMKSSAPGTVKTVLDWARVHGTIALLSRATLSSITEPLSVGVRTGSITRGLEAFADSFKSIIGTSDMRQARQAAEIMGVVADSAHDTATMAQFGGWDAKGQQKIVTAMFRATGLHQLTEGQRVAASRIGQVWVRQLADEVAEGAPKQASAKRLLAELGIDEQDARQLSAWLKRNDGTPSMADLAGGTPEGAKYRAAIARFVNESIQNPEAVDKPALAGNAIGRMVYGITSFNFAFTRNVLLRTMKSTATAVSERGLTLGDRARLAGPMAAFLLLSASQFGMSRVREMLFNSQQNDERDPWLKTVLDMDRMGVWGTASPIVNWLTAAKYQRSLTGMAVGPYLSNILDGIDPITRGLIGPTFGGTNSPNTTRSEWKAVRGAYQLLVAPAVVAGLSMAPGGSYLRMLYGVGAMAAGSPGASRGLADALVGKQPTRGREKKGAYGTAEY